jgi:hypothetical protein
VRLTSLIPLDITDKISCSDSVLINGRGSVFCHDPQEMTEMIPPPAMAIINASLTDKGWVNPCISQIRYNAD